MSDDRIIRRCEAVPDKIITQHPSPRTLSGYTTLAHILHCLKDMGTTRKHIRHDATYRRGGEGWSYHGW